MNKKIVLAAVASLFLLGAGCVSFSSAPPVQLGIYRSADKGENWKSINTLLSAAGNKSIAGVKVYKVVTDPLDHNALYLATRASGLLYSYDRGDSWQLAAGLQGKFIYGVAVDPTNKCTIYVTDGSLVLKTTDCSRSWTTVYTSQNGLLVGVAVDFGNHSNVFAASGSGTILESQNAGGSWRVIQNFNLPLRDLVADPLAPGRLFAAGVSKGLYRSDDSGATWQYAADGLQNFGGGLTFYRLVLDQVNKDSIYWLSQYGIFHSTDAGKTWTDLKLLTSPGSVNIYTFAINPKNPKELFYTATVLGAQNQVNSSKLYKSQDGGTNWFNRNLPSSAIPVSLIENPDDPNLLFIAFTNGQ